MEEVFLSKKHIDTIVQRVADEITNYYWETNEVLIVGVLEGAKPFVEDLYRRLSDKFTITYLKASSYYNNTSSSEEVDIDFSMTGFVTGRNILLIDDIYDTGYTIDAITKKLKQMDIISLATCVLLNRINNHKKDVNINFKGVDVRHNKFLIGYGLDDKGERREQQYITMKEEEDD